MKKKNETVVFMDTTNKIVDDDYAQSLITEFRKRTKWEALKGSPVYNHLIEFSKGYSKKKRNVSEVVEIFKIAYGIR